MSYSIDSAARRRSTVATRTETTKRKTSGEDVIATLVITVIELGVISIGSYYLSKWISDKIQQAQAGPRSSTASASQIKSRLEQILYKRSVALNGPEAAEEEEEELPPLNDYEVMIAEDVVDPSAMENTFAHVGGMDDIKKELWELAVLPLLRPDLFLCTSQLVRPTRGILLYGKPGTGKTLLAKAMAKEAKAAFIAVKLSKIMDKWFGESNKLIAATFSLAEKLAPSVVFIDEIDTFLNPRDGLEGSASGAIKSEFLTLWDGLTTAQTKPVLVLGATNRPHNVDPAILRRLPRAFCIGLPNAQGRFDILTLLLKDSELTRDAIDFLPTLAQVTRGYSGSDLKEMCRAAAMEPIREIMSETSRQAVMGESNGDKRVVVGPPKGKRMRPLEKKDFVKGLEKVKRTGQAAYAYGEQTEGTAASSSSPDDMNPNEMAKQLSTFMRLLSNVSDQNPETDEESDDSDGIPNM